MVPSRELEKFAKEWIDACSGDSFQFGDLLDAYNEKHPVPADEIEYLETRMRSVLDNSGFAVRPHSSDSFYIIEKFFAGTVFYCRPRDFEIEEGILIPGARFEPFHHPDLFVDDFEVDSAAGKLSTRSFRCEYGKVSDLYFMLGPAGTMDLLTAESAENYETISHHNGLNDIMPVVQDVLDMRAFYSQTGFRPGDLLKFTLVSYMNASFRVEHVPYPDAPSKKEVDRWVDEFETSLSRVCHEYRDSLEIAQQLMMAYVYAAEYESDLRKMPAPPIDSYHSMMRMISFRRDSAEWTLDSMEPEDTDQYPQEQPSAEGSDAPESPETAPHECACGENHRHAAKPDDGHGSDPFADEHGVVHNLSPDDFGISGGATDSLDAILRDAKSSLSELEIKSLMLDSLASGIDSFEEFSRTNSDCIKLAFRDEAQETSFLNYTEDLWELLAEQYNPERDNFKAPLRQRVLELARRRSELVDSLNERGLFSLISRFHSGLEQTHRNIVDTIAVIDSDTELAEGDSRYESLEFRIGDLEDDFESLAGEIDSETAKKKP